MKDSKENDKQDVSEKRHERDQEEVIAEGVAVFVNGGFEGFDHRKKNLKAILKLMKVRYTCKSADIKYMAIGVYKYETSNVKNTKWGKNKKGTM